MCSSANADLSVARGLHVTGMIRVLTCCIAPFMAEHGCVVSRMRSFALTSSMKLLGVSPLAVLLTWQDSPARRTLPRNVRSLRYRGSAAFFVDICSVCCNGQQVCA